MSRVCEICGRGPRVGNNVSHAHNVSKRRFNINLQTMHVIIDGTPKHIKVCTRCIQAGKIERPKFQLRERKPKALKPKEIEVAVTAEALEEEAVSEYFSSASIVDVIFKPKKKALPEGEEETEAGPEETLTEEEKAVAETKPVKEAETKTETELQPVVPDEEVPPTGPEPAEEDYQNVVE